MVKPKRIDFGDIKWGTLTSAQRRYNREHPGAAPTVKSFATRVVKHPDMFSDKMVRKARFYQNILN